MTKTNVLLVAGVLFVWALSSCAKTGANGNTTGSPGDTTKTKPNPGGLTNGCRIVGIVDSLSGSKVVGHDSIFYDSQGRVDSIWMYPVAGAVERETFQRKGDTVIMATFSGSYNSIDTAIVDSAGLLTQEVIVSPGARAINRYTYSGTEIVQWINQGVAGSSTTTYNWSGGDMLSMTSVASGGGGTTVTFGYNTQPSVAGDYWQLGGLVSEAAPFIVTAHQVTSITEGSQTFTYVYSMDSAGNITMMTSSLGGAFWSQYKYTYSCH